MIPTFNTFSQELFEFAGAISAGFVARLLALNTISPVGAALGAPAVVLADHLAQAILFKIMDLPCIRSCCPKLHSFSGKYGFIMAKPLTFGLTVLLTMGIAAIAGVSYAIGTAIVVAAILTTGLFMAQVAYRIVKEMLAPCVRCCTPVPNADQPSNLLTTTPPITPPQNLET
jgi:hypothetical protein